MELFPRLDVSLPEDESNPDARAASLRRDRDAYVWDWSWPPGCATLRRLPDDDRYPPRFIALTAELQVKVRANHASLAFANLDAPPPLPARHEDLARTLFSAAESFHVGAPRTRPDAVADYADYFARFPAPPLLDRLRAHPDEADLLFAWQRVGGANPMSLRRIARLPEGLAVADAQWQAAVGAGSLDAALDDGRVFAVDFTFLHGAPCTAYLGRQKYLCGARGVFTTAGGGALRPVAIQLEPGGTVFSPADGVAWAMARYCLQVADANVHETMAHLGSTHMVMEAVGAAARRQLSASHPLRVLLEPHLVGTFAINESAKTSLIAPEGTIDHAFAARIDVAAGLVRTALNGFVLQDRAPALELAARGVDDRERLPEYPYRDDVLAVYGAIVRFTEGYARAWYRDDAAVARDPELRAWVAECGSPVGGALVGVRPVETVADLATWLANILHIASAQHAAVNFPQWPFFGWCANTAGACWAPPPRAVADGAAGALGLMPPWDCAILQSDTVFQLSGVYYNRLGDYGLQLPPRARGAADAFAKELAAIDARIAEADGTRRLPYPFLRPSLVPASINI